MSSRFLLGAAGWNPPEWGEAFYPSDMPEEWRLTYYNTQFECVFLDESTWREAGAANHEAWGADTHEHFLFLLENASDGELPGVLADRAVGLRKDDARVLWFDRHTTMKQLARRLAEVADDTPHYLISADADLGQVERVRTLLDLMGL